jgi:hypothetical protein
LLSPFVGQRLVMLASRENGDDLEPPADLAARGESAPVLDRVLGAGRVRGKIVVRIADAAPATAPATAPAAADEPAIRP